MRRERQGASSPRRRPPALRLCAALGSGTEESAGTRAQRGTAPADSRSRVSRQGSHTLEAERASEREPGRKPPGQGGRTRAPRELRAEREDCQLPSSPQALAPKLSVELGTRKLSAPQASPNHRPRPAKAGVFPILQLPALGGYFSLSSSDKAAPGVAISTSFEVERWIALKQNKTKPESPDFFSL